MALWQSKQVAAQVPLTETNGSGRPVHLVTEFIVPAGFALNDVVEMLGVPAYHVLSSIRVFSDQVDSNGAPTVTLDVGFITGTYGDAVPLVARTCGTEFLAASTTPLRAGGYADPPVTNVQMGRQVATTAARGIGVKVAAAIATLVVGARIRMACTYIADPGLLT